MYELLCVSIKANRNRAYLHMRVWVRDVSPEGQRKGCSERAWTVGGKLVHNVLYMGYGGCKLPSSAPKIAVRKGPLPYQAKHVAPKYDWLQALAYKAVKDIGVAI